VRSRRRWLTAAVAGLWVASLTGGVSAGNDLNFRTGNNPVTVGSNGLVALTADAVTWNDNWNVEQTDANTTICFNCGQQELNVYDGDYGNNGIPGYFRCNNWLNDTVCGWGEVNLNVVYYDTAGEARSLMCEEVGHSLGLDHDWNATNSCMKRPVCWACTRLSSHDVNVVNTNY
jgi:hypothetical protein